MTWQIVWDGPARRDLRRMDRATAARVREAVVRLAQTNQGDVKQLRDRGGEWRLRVGDWRVRFVLDRETWTIEVLRVLPRGRAYRE